MSALDDHLCTLELAALEGKRNEREQRSCIREAARLLRHGNEAFPDWVVERDAWLALPAVQSALALEAADRGES